MLFQPFLSIYLIFSARDIVLIFDSNQILIADNEFWFGTLLWKVQCLALYLNALEISDVLFHKFILSMCWLFTNEIIPPLWYCILKQVKICYYLLDFMQIGGTIVKNKKKKKGICPTFESIFNKFWISCKIFLFLFVIVITNLQTFCAFEAIWIIITF